MKEKLPQRWPYWVGLTLSEANTLFFLNAAIYHFWAAYVPPYETVPQSGRAAQFAITFVASAAAFVWFVVRLRRTRQKRE